MYSEKPESMDEAARVYGELWEGAYDEDVLRTFEGTRATIKETMLGHLEGENADQPLIYFENMVITRRQADSAACRLGNGLLGLGVNKGDRVGIVASNRPETVLSFMACYKSGFVAAAYNQRCTSCEIERALANVGATALIIEEDTLAKLMSVLQGDALPALKVVVVLEASDCCCGADSWSEGIPPTSSRSEVCLPKEIPVRLVQSDFTSLLHKSSVTEPCVNVTGEDAAIILFTGGTTGISKACCQTHGRMVLELEAMHHWVRSSLKSGPANILVCMPMTHIMGINYGVHWQLVNGGSVVIASGNKPQDIKMAFERYRPSVWATLPTLLHSIASDEDIAQTPYANLDLVIFGGSFISKDLLDDLIAKTRARFVESYGMSESFGFVTCNPVRSMGKVGSIGIPLSNTDVLVVDAQQGIRPLAPGERGEIVFRGPQIIQEYWNNSAETKIALRNGWLYSGDIGYMDQEGFFYLVDRKKDTIVVSGFNVFPNEIDETLLTYPDVMDACTVGVPDEHSGERPKSFIVMKNGAQLDKSNLIAHCRERLVAYKVPKYFEVVEEIPKTKARKPDRAFLRRIELQKKELETV